MRVGSRSVRVKRFITSVCLCSGLIILASASAYANQILQYNYTPDPRRLSQFQEVVPKLSAQTTPQIASVDLNEDGIREFIVRANDCDEGAQTLCDHVVIGQVSKGYIILGTLRGKKLLLGQDYTKGVRNLLLFSNPVNDFDYDIYVWGAKQAQYVLK